MSEYLTEREAAPILRVTMGTLANWRWKGTGPDWTRAGGRVLYSRRVLEAYLRDNTRSGR